MTIYAHHPTRGKVQILATYRTDLGLHSSTVTSVETTDLAEPIVDALNRISACLTIPVCEWDTRRNGIKRYPREHLDAALDPGRRGELLTGSHSLWYEYVKLVLHEALEDLDDACTQVPDPVRTAVEAELITETLQLQAALAYPDTPARDGQSTRLWDRYLPTVLFGGGLHELTERTRETMNRAEEGRFAGAVDRAIEDLRILFAAHARCSEPSARLDDAGLSIVVEPPDQAEVHGYYLSIDAPAAFRSGLRGWRVAVCRWVPDPDYSDDEGGTETGEPLVTCDLASRPHVSEITELVDQVGSTDAKLIEWAQTPTGDALAGTGFIVTTRSASSD